MPKFSLTGETKHFSSSGIGPAEIVQQHLIAGDDRFRLLVEQRQSLVYERTARLDAEKIVGYCPPPGSWSRVSSLLRNHPASKYSGEDGSFFPPRNIPYCLFYRHSRIPMLESVTSV